MNNSTISLALIILSFSFLWFGQFEFDESTISMETSEIVKKIKKVNIVMNSGVGFSEVRPKQFDHFTQLRKKASIDELMDLTNHPNGTVRSYAFWALSYNPSVDLLPIIVKHLNDNEVVLTFLGCTVTPKSVGNFFIELVTTPHDNDIDSNVKKLNPSQRKKLDRILITRPNH